MSSYVGPMFTIYEEVDILNLAGVTPGDEIMIKSGKGTMVKMPMPHLLKGECFRIRIPLADPVVKTAPTRITLEKTSKITSGPSACWLKPPTVKPPRVPKKKSPPLPPRPNKK